jgi:hypothetical protein
MPARLHARPFRRLVILASVVLAAALVSPTRAQEKQQAAKKKTPAEVMKSLEQLVKDYQDENAALRERVTDLERQVETLKQNRVVNVVPQPGAPAQVPPGWKPFQFNGGTYYVVPLAAGSSNVTKIDTLVTTPAQPAPRQSGAVVVPPPQK